MWSRLPKAKDTLKFSIPLIFSWRDVQDPRAGLGQTTGFLGQFCHLLLCGPDRILTFSKFYFPHVVVCYFCCY